jgi:Flp pilus assembly protein TadD
MERALEQDTNYALAYAALADGHLTLTLFSRSPIQATLPKARAAALKAVGIDPALGEAHAALAAVRTKEWDWNHAEAEYKQALELNPNSATTHNSYGGLLGDLRRFDEAVQEVQRARDLDPLSPIITANLGLTLYLNQRYDEAIAEYRKVQELSPESALARWGMAHAYGMKGMSAELIKELQTARALAGSSPRFLGCLGYAYGIAGRTEDARKVLDELKNYLQQGYPLQTDVAHVYHGLDDRKNTLDWLEQALEIRADIWLPKLNSDPVWQNLRSEPRFVALLKRMGLPQ